jgi:hypothetical protein
MHHKSPDNHGARRDRLIHERVHDPYKTPHKLPEPTVCPDQNDQPDALEHGYRGELDLHYDEEGCFLRVTWQRET